MSSIPKKFAVISDLHVRSGRDGDWIDKYLCAVQWCRDNGYVLYSVGDMIEGYDPNTNLETINSYVRTELINALMDGTYIVGNHDNSMIDNNNQEDYIRDRRKKIVLTHGQRFDFWFKDEAAEVSSDWWGKTVYRAEKLNLNRIANAMRIGANAGFTKKAFKYMVNNDIRFMACGHTHRPEILFRDGRTLAVTGAWNENATDDQRKIVVVDGAFDNAKLVGIGDMVYVN